MRSLRGNIRLTFLFCIVWCELLLLLKTFFSLFSTLLFSFPGIFMTGRCEKMPAKLIFLDILPFVFLVKEFGAKVKHYCIIKVSTHFSSQQYYKCNLWKYGICGAISKQTFLPEKFRLSGKDSLYLLLGNFMVCFENARKKNLEIHHVPLGNIEFCFCFSEA